MTIHRITFGIEDRGAEANPRYRVIGELPAQDFAALTTGNNKRATCEAAMSTMLDVLRITKEDDNVRAVI